MSTTHYSASASAADTERYIRGKEDERGIAITCDVPGGPGAFSARARSLTQNTTREVEAVHYRQSFSDEEFDPKSPEDVQRVNDLGYQLAKKMHPDSDCLVVSHVDGRGKKPHNHILVINHNNRTGKALSDYRTFHDRKAGNQRGVQSANDQLMREHGLSVVKRLEHAPKDWELRREDGEHVGYIEMSADGRFIPYDRLWARRGEAMELDEAEAVLDAIGLRLLAEDWLLEEDDPQTGEASWTRVRIREIHRDRVIVARAMEDLSATSVAKSVDLIGAIELPLPTTRLRSAS